MDDLRLMLLVAGVVLIALIYFWETGRRRLRRQDPQDGSSGDPPLGSLSAADGDDDPLERAQDELAARNARALVGIEDFDIDADQEVVVRPVDDAPIPAPPLAYDDNLSAENLGPSFFNDDAQPHDASLNSGRSKASPADGEANSARPNSEVVSVRARRRNPEQLDLDGLSARSESGGSGRDADEDRFMVAITVMAKGSAALSGSALGTCFESENLRFGERQLYHRYERGQALRAQPLFSVVNVVKPGVFDPDALGALRTPGLVVFMDVAAVREPSAVFDDMLSTARRLAESLDAKICDQSRMPLSAQAINHLRETVAEQARRRRLRG